MIFKERPADFQVKTRVVACYVEHADKFLLLQRQPNKPHGGKWGLPAGKVDQGEDLKSAVCREVFEETGIRVDDSKLIHLGVLWVRHDGNEFEYHSFSVEMEGDSEVKLSPSEHQNHLWVSLSESVHMDLIHDLAECNELFLTSRPR